MFVLLYSQPEKKVEWYSRRPSHVEISRADAMMEVDVKKWCDSDTVDPTEILEIMRRIVETEIE